MQLFDLYKQLIRWINNLNKEQFQMRIKTQPTSSHKLHKQVPTLHIPRQQIVFEEFLRQNNLKKARQAKQQMDFYLYPTMIDQPKQHFSVNPEAMENLRQKFKKQYKKYNKILRRNMENEQRFLKKRAEQQAMQQVLEKARRKQYKKDQIKALEVKNKYLKQRQKNTSLHLKLWQDKIQQTQNNHQKQLKQSIKKLQAWQKKIQLSSNKKIDQLSRVSSASKSHNQHVNSVLVRKRQMDQEDAERNLLIFQQKSQIYNKRHQTVISHSKSNSSCSVSRNKLQKSNKQRFQKLISKDFLSMLSKSIDKQQKIRQARSKKKSKISEIQELNNQKHNYQKYKINQNIKILAKQRKQRDLKLNKIYSKAEIPLINHNYQQLRSNKSRTNQIYLTEISQHIQKTPVNDKTHIRNRQKRQMSLINKYRYSEKQSNNQILLGMSRPKDFACKYNSAILDKLRNMTRKVRQSKKINSYSQIVANKKQYSKKSCYL